jgi:Tfp pilus assembly protein PilN
MIVALVLVIAGIATALSYTASADAQVNRSFSERFAVYRDLAGQISQIDALQNREAVIAQQAQVDAAMLDLIPHSRALAEISKLQPPAIRLTTLEIAPAKETGIVQTVLLDGVSCDPAQTDQFVQGLGTSGWLTNVKCDGGSAMPRHRLGPFHFSIRAELVPMTL